MGPSNPLLGIYPEKATIIKDTCAPTLRAALFTITRTRKQPRRPSADKWTSIHPDKWVSIHPDKWMSIHPDKWMSIGR